MTTIKAAVFWILSLTWGLPITAVGLIVALCLLLTGHKPNRFHWYIYFEVGQGWGGFGAGGVFVVSKDASEHTRKHECGHGLQNIVLGPFMPLLVSIPSMIRYWYREYLIRYKNKEYSNLPDYDSIWFEGSASKLGEKYF